jgi:hypothetical protein
LNKTDPKAVVLQFNHYINSRDLDGISSLITHDHTLIDPGDTSPGKEKALGAWNRFFKACPDYINHFKRLESKDEFIAATGHATCSREE